MQTEDGYIISKCLEGDSAAFGILVDRYKNSIYALAYSKLGDFADAEDVAQEVFIKAYRNLHKLRRWDSFHVWLYSITINICKMRIRSKNNRPDREYAEDMDREVIENPSVDSYREELVFKSLHEALDSLPDIHRQVLTLHYFGGMNIREVAEVLGRSTRTIDRWLKTARSLLKEEMLVMMNTTYEQQKLQTVFTLRIIETIKHIRINPISLKPLPWGLSLTVGIIALIFGTGQHLSWQNSYEISSISDFSGRSTVLELGEYPINVLSVADESFLTNNSGNDKGIGSEIPSLQNAFFLASHAEGGTWTKKANMLTARYNLATSVVDGKIYAIGGQDRNSTFVSTVEVYDPVKDKWTKKTDMPTAREGLSTSTVDGKIYAIGGYLRGQHIEFSIVEEYDPVKDKWTKKADMPTGRQYFSTVAVNGKIYAIGGWRNGVALSTVEEYDPVADKWKKKSDMPDTRYGLSAEAVNGKIYVIGGCPLGGIPLGHGGILSTVEEYDPILDKWTKKTDMPTARNFLTANVVNGKIYAIGGYDMVNILSNVEEYDPIKDKWTKKADIPTARALFSSSAANGKIYAIGGDRNGTVEEYDPGTAGQSINFKGKLPTTWGDVKFAQSK